MIQTQLVKSVTPSAAEMIDDCVARRSPFAMVRRAAPDTQGRHPAGRHDAGSNSSGRDDAGSNSAGRDGAGANSAGPDDAGLIELLVGDVCRVERLADLPIPADPDSQSLAVVPYRQIRERGFDAVDDGAPLLCLRATTFHRYPVPEILAAVPDRAPRLGDGAFDVDDLSYAETVRSVLAEEIGRGEGANFVIHRTYRAPVDEDPLQAALAVFARLLRAERGAYWTFFVYTGDRILVGATPERHVSVEGGLATMNPISGTYRHPAGHTSADREGLLRFLADRKEIEELHMVLDEELKMMAAVADLGGQVIGPYLKEMTHLTHTEYLLAGRTSLDVREVLRLTMFAPTVTGSPIENACRVIARHEGRGRGYYAGVLAMLGTDAAGRQRLDAPILIRTVEFDVATRTLRVPVGATLVRDSVPASEVAETYAKAAGVLAALGLTRRLATDPVVDEALHRRNETLSRFWIEPRDPRAAPRSQSLAGRTVLVVDAEDSFTAMLANQLRALGMTVTVRPYLQVPPMAAYDLVVAGPGPGDPGDDTDPKIRALRTTVGTALERRTPLLAICLGHQVLCTLLGLRMVRRDRPYQGLQREIDFFGRSERVGFYSTFTAMAPARPAAGIAPAAEPALSAAGADLPAHVGPVELATDPATGEVCALRGEHFAGVQFHPESVLTEHGIDLLREIVERLLPAADEVDQGSNL